MKNSVTEKAAKFRDGLSLGSYIFYVFLCLMLLAACGSIVGNLLTHFPMAANIKWVLAILLCVVGFVVLRKGWFVEQYKALILAMVMFVIILPSWFYGGGDNTITLLYLLLITCEAFLMLEHLAVKCFFGVASLLSCVALTYLTDRYPHLIQGNGGQNVFADTLIQIVIIFVLTIVSAGIYTGRYYRQNAQLTKLNARLNEMAITDELTGIYNRRKSMELLTARCQAGGAPFFIVMLDIDCFKTINDTFGHVAGDRAIGCLAAHLKQVVGDRGFAGRYGGDEFILLLRAMTPDEDVEFERALLHVPPCKGGEIMTISAGLARYEPGLTCDDLITRADQLLLNAKRGGKNRLERDLT